MKSAVCYYLKEVGIYRGSEILFCASDGKNEDSGIGLLDL